MTAITLSHKIRLVPTQEQRIYFAKACGTARFTWNWALAEWKKLYALGEKPGGLSLKKQFNAIKQKEYPWIYEVTKYASQQPFIFLQTAFTRFFRKESRYPRFKKKGVDDSFYIGNDQIKIQGNRIKIPRLGWVKMRETLRFIGKVISATVSRAADKWFVSVNVELNQKPAICENQVIVGIDLGIKTLATLYDGEKIQEVAGTKPLRNLLQRLRRTQRSLSRKQKGSNNRNKQCLKVANLHYRIKCLRQDVLHKLTTLITKTYSHIVIEDLNIKGMLSNRKLARSISDMGLYEFRRQLSYKSQLRGNHIEVVDRWYPSSKKCSSCGKVKAKLGLCEREYKCDTCGLEIDRDHNAAKNLFNVLSTASLAGFKVCGEAGAGSNA